MSNGWKEIDDELVCHTWQCQGLEECCSRNREIAVLTPDWYEENGTPICSCGEDMTYVKTELKVG